MRLPHFCLSPNAATGLPRVPRYNNRTTRMIEDEGGPCYVSLLGIHDMSKMRRATRKYIFVVRRRIGQLVTRARSTGLMHVNITEDDHLLQRPVDRVSLRCR